MGLLRSASERASPLLPDAARAHLQGLLEGVGLAPLKAAQARSSVIYRDGGASDRAIGDEAAALAYVVARLPATYAACVSAMNAVRKVVPEFAPRTQLDLGAGPGTAALAARVVWSSLAQQVLVEPHGRLRALGQGLVRASGAEVDWVDARLAALTGAALTRLDLTKPVQAADLVTLSYVLAELGEDEVEGLLKGLRGLFQSVLLIVEPGTPHGFKRLLRAREALLALGAEMLAPCPHFQACPLTASDWCHFSVRLARSTAHKALKGADVPFEDEPYAYLAVTFDRQLKAARPMARVLRNPVVEKGFVDVVVCAANGQRETRRVLRRDKAAYKSAKNAEPGDGV
ncbi:MAG: small ribosomal subunit Rsm22 family protein [Hyphomicrobiaceae bacterium]|nr:hypothetical protein [Hyphomicrobiaceae bacterium]